MNKYMNFVAVGIFVFLAAVAAFAIWGSPWFQSNWQNINPPQIETDYNGPAIPYERSENTEWEELQEKEDSICPILRALHEYSNGNPPPAYC